MMNPSEYSPRTKYSPLAASRSKNMGSVAICPITCRKPDFSSFRNALRPYFLRASKTCFSESPARDGEMVLASLMVLFFTDYSRGTRGEAKKSLWMPFTGSPLAKPDRLGTKIRHAMRNCPFLLSYLRKNTLYYEKKVPLALGAPGAGPSLPRSGGRHPHQFIGVCTRRPQSGRAGPDAARRRGPRRLRTARAAQRKGRVPG